MRNKTIILSILLLFAALLSACSGVASAKGLTGATLTQEATTPPRSLNVSGHGEVQLTPDIAYITIGVHTEGKDAAEAVTSNTSQTQKVVDALKKAGVEDKDIRTTNFSIYPQQQYDQQGSPTGEINYVVDNSVYVTVRDLGSIGDLLNAAISAGANSVYGITFDVEDKSEALSEARAKAVKDAQTQAGELSKAAGVTLGDILVINGSGGVVPTPYYDVKLGMGGGAAQAGATVPVSPGQLVISADVSMVYEIR